MKLDSRPPIAVEGKLHGNDEKREPLPQSTTKKGDNIIGLFNFQRTNLELTFFPFPPLAYPVVKRNFYYWGWGGLGRGENGFKKGDQVASCCATWSNFAAYSRRRSAAEKSRIGPQNSRPIRTSNGPRPYRAANQINVAVAIAVTAMANLIFLIFHLLQIHELSPTLSLIKERERVSYDGLKGGEKN